MGFDSLYYGKGRKMLKLCSDLDFGPTMPNIVAFCKTATIMIIIIEQLGHKCAKETRYNSSEVSNFKTMS